MGLDIAVYTRTYEHGFRAGSYSGFGEWRKELASMVGIDLYAMRGYEGTIDWEDDTPFIELLNHSDCDGRLGYDECVNLLEDFEKYSKDAKDKASSMSKDDGEWFLEKYNDWLEAVKMVADDEDREIIFC